MTEIPTIECSSNGPYVVRNLESLRNSRGDSIPVQPVVALCRCGGSANKPFCDGTHQKNGFSGATRVHRGADQRNDYVGRRITIHDNRAICSHARHCTEGLAAVFKYGSQPWIDPDGAAIDAIIDTIRRCPSGALSYSLDGVEQQATARQPAITVMKDGPYAVVGGVGLIGQRWGQGASTEHYTLCRCGASRNKPFCDGRHRSSGFKDERN
jgi:CDGSH-type Zn-finger protein